MLEKQWEQYKSGAKTCGSGPSSSERTAREMAKQKREAIRLVEELDILDTGRFPEQDAVAKAFQKCQIDPISSFEPKSKADIKNGEDAQKNAASVYMISLNRRRLRKNAIKIKIKGLAG